MNVGVLTIATKKYVQFVPQLWWSLEKHFCPGHAVTLFVHSDQQVSIDMSRKTRQGFDLHVIGQDHLGWPGATLFRYRVFTRNKPLFEPFNFLIYLDVDMRVVAPINDEIFGDLVAVQHPGFVGKKPDALPFENRERSVAFVPMAQRKEYRCGGVQGGSGAGYMVACETVRGMIEQDLDRGTMPVWHDESVWNKYLIDHPPTKVLGAEFCVPEEFAVGWRPAPRILALQKNHAEVRT